MRPVSAPLRLATAVAALALVAGLAACVDPDAAPALPSGQPSIPPAETPTIEPTVGAVPLAVDCAALVDPDVVYALNPNLALLGSWSPDDGTPGARALAAAGVACQWVLESGGGTMEVSAARLSAAELADLEADAVGGQSVGVSAGRAYFESVDGSGVMTAFRDDLWIVVASPLFTEPGEPATVLESALTAVPAD